MRSTKYFIFILISTLFLFASCTTEVTLTLQEDNSLDIHFEGGAGAAFAKMINSAAGVNASASEGGVSDNGNLFIDKDSVAYELAKAGFSNVKVNQKKDGTVSILMSDKKQTSYLFTSKIIKVADGRLTSAITRKSLEDFYTAADEQTSMILDLFLAPVFNNEEMSEEEYLEMVGAFYGEAAADEVRNSFVRINLISRDGSKENLRIPLAQLMCGNL